MKTSEGIPPPRSRNACAFYVHIPFCESKCGYCDFYSVAVKDRDTAPLVAAIISEIRRRNEQNDYCIQTIFCGGGTPTVLPVEQLRSLLQTIRECIDLRNVQEFTVEANPATVDDAKAALLAESGVSRISMGAQSFVPGELATLERLHSPNDIEPSMSILRRNGFRQINLDLIFGVPGQTIETWRYSLGRALELKPDHIACYGLTYEPGTRLTAQFSAGRLNPCDEDLEADMYLCAVEILESAGYAQYEISNYACAGCQSLHNLMYWRNKPYIGIGPSAAGYINDRRYKNISDIAGYTRLIRDNGIAEVESETIEGASLIHELVLMQLRLNEGISIHAFRERTGLDPLALFEAPLQEAMASELVEIDRDAIRLTSRGRLVTNRVMVDLVAVVPDREMALTVLSH